MYANLMRQTTTATLLSACVLVSASALRAAAAPVPLTPSTEHPVPARPLLDTERQAVQLAVAYLDKGAESWWGALSRRSPLRTLGHDAALREIEVRAGPAEGARWELRTLDASTPAGTAIFSVDFPSGIDELLLLRFVRQEDAWKLDSVRTLAEPSAWNKRLQVDPNAARAPAPGIPFYLQHPLASSVAGLLLALLLVVSGLVFVSGRFLSFTLTLSGSLLGSAAALLFFHLLANPELPQVAKPKPASRESFPHLAALLPLRREMETEDGSKALRAPNLPEGSEASEVARLWIVQRNLRANALEPARRALEAFPTPSTNPWLETLRGRLAFLQKREADAALAYEHALAIGPLHDGILLEAAQIFTLLSFEAPANIYNQKLLKIVSRAAEVHYQLAQVAATEHRLPDAEKEFLTGWALRPLAHRELFESSWDWELLHRPAIKALLRLDSPLEPTLNAAEKSKHPLELPAGAAEHLCGRLLRIVLGTAEVSVPGGAELAASELVAEDAGAQDRSEEAEALAQSARFVSRPPSVATLSMPLLRRQIERTCRSLAEHQRWDEVVAITSAFRGRDEQVPSGLVLLRSRALQRTKNSEEARKILTDLAANAAFLKRSSPTLLYEFGEMLVTFDEFDLAMRMIQKGAPRIRMDFLSERLRQVRTQQRLHASYSTSEAAHFHLRYPPERAATFALGASRVLEAERTRLLKWIPGASERPVSVQLLWYDEFRRTYAGGADILGLFDGTVRIPLAGVAEFSAPVVAIMTHELAHAMVADVTEGRAPHWFQEGMAQHVEMRRFRPNYITEYQAQHSLLSLPVVEGVLQSFSDAALMEQAYQESEWVVAFIEARYGLPGIHRLLKAFREGRQSEQAIREALHLSLAELDAAFISWSLQQPKMLRDTVIAYDTRPDENFRLSKPPRDEPAGKKPLEIPDSLYGGN